MLPPNLVPPPFDMGSVWLVGAGPGDPGLLTLHALHALTEAEIILHDALVPEEILSLAPQARLEAAGKRAGGERTPQLRINQRLIALARQGRRVVRLKGGDPLIFGRGGEEALALAAAGIPFRIVPGISAGVGGTAASGIPLTHRGLARSVTFATGHDVAGLGRIPLTDVLVLYMAGRNLGTIAARLMQAGRDKADAVALIQDATRPEQTVRVTTLAQAAGAQAAGADAVDRPASRAPVLIVVGPVVALRDHLAGWQQTSPMTVVGDPCQARIAG
jgi:uroporphyrin-III C-methyltransferase